MGVKEYFAFDPDTSSRRRRRRKLQGWQFNRSTDRMEAMALDAQGRLWSQYLESFLVPDGKWLRLSDNLGQRRLTQAEAEARRAEALAEKLSSLGINPDEV